MGHVSEKRFLVLHGLRLKGFGEPPGIGAAVGLDAATVAELLAKLAADDLVLRREGRLAGWALTPAGRAEQQALAAADLDASGAATEVRAAYDTFLTLNDDFKVLCTDWQLRDGALYDHGDPAYNAAILERLRTLHGALHGVLDQLSARLDRYGHYAPRFDAALERLEAGELEYLTKPLIDSYHTIWFELHEDLLSCLRIERSEEGSY